MKRIIIAAVIVAVVGAIGIVAFQRFQSSPGGTLPESATPSGFVPEQYFICPDGSSHGPGVPTESIASWCKKNGFGANNTAPQAAAPDAARQTYYDTSKGIEFQYPAGWEVLVNNPANATAINLSVRDRKYQSSVEWPGLALTEMPSDPEEFYNGIYFDKESMSNGMIRIRLFTGGKTLYATCALYLDQGVYDECNRMLASVRSPSRPADSSAGVADAFEFNYSFGVGEQNMLYTRERKYIKDMVVEPHQEYTMALTPEEKEKIRQSIIENNIFAAKGDYVQNCDAQGVCMRVMPLSSATLNVWLQGQHKVFHWRADYIDTNDDDARRLKAVMDTINEIIAAKEKEMKIPQPRSGYR